MRSIRTLAAARLTCTTLLFASMTTVGLAQSNALERARQYRDSGDLTKALNDYRRWLLEHQQDMNSLREFAEVNAWLGRTDDAETAYNIVLRAEPHNAAALNGSGYANAWAGDHSKARDRFLAALVLDSADLDARKGMAYATLWAGMCADAGKRFAALRDEHPELLELWIGVGDAAKCAGDHRGAARHYEAAAARFPHEALPRERLDALRREASEMELDVWAGPSNVDGLRGNGLRLIQLSRKFGDRWRAYARYDRSISIENTDLLRRSASGQVLSFGTFHKWNKHHGTLLEVAFRLLDDAPTQRALRAEHVLFMRRDLSVKGGIQWAKGSSTPADWLYYLGGSYRAGRLLTLEPMLLFASPQREVSERRLVLAAKLTPGRGYEVNAGYVLGASRIHPEGGTQQRMRMNGVFINGLFPVSRPVWLMASLRHENGFFSELTSFAIGARLRFSAIQLPSRHN
jgi:tetratricopeptide (TPR) repeat protein